MSSAAAALTDRSPEPGAEAPSLVVERLTTSIRIDRQWFDAVRDVSFEVHPRETLALVGESGCGKSLTALSVMFQLAPAVGEIIAELVTEGRSSSPLVPFSIDRFAGATAVEKAAVDVGP